LTTTRYAPGYTVDSSRPGSAKRVNQDLNNTGANPLRTGYGVGLVPAASVAAGISVEERGDGVLHQTVLTLTAVSVPMTDATTNGCHGSIQLYDFPQCLLVHVASNLSLTLTAGAGGVADGAAVVAAVGTVTTATDNAALTTTEADLVPSTAFTLSSGTVLARNVSTTALGAIVFDGTATAKDAWLNIAVPDADSSANDTISVTGTVILTWINGGDV
jgi:hypothetical protein